MIIGNSKISMCITGEYSGDVIFTYETVGVEGEVLTVEATLEVMAEYEIVVKDTKVYEGRQEVTVHNVTDEDTVHMWEVNNLGKGFGEGGENTLEDYIFDDVSSGSEEDVYDVDGIIVDSDGELLQQQSRCIDYDVYEDY